MHSCFSVHRENVDGIILEKKESCNRREEIIATRNDGIKIKLCKLLKYISRFVKKAIHKDRLIVQR